MKRTVLTIVALLVGMTLASVATECPTGQQDNPWFHQWEGLAPVDQGQNDGTSITTDNGQTDWVRCSGTPGSQIQNDTPGQRSGRDWGDDILVGNSGSIPTLGRLTTDAAANGDMYVGLLVPNAGVDDTGLVWLSTDAGQTWSPGPVVVGNATSGGIVDYQILVGSDVYYFVQYELYGLWVRASGIGWVQISTDTTIRRISVDRNIESPEHVFVCWTESDGDIRMLTSNDGGSTWGNANWVSSGRRGASFAAGADGYGYVAYMDATDSTYYRVGRFTNNLISPAWSFVTLDTSSDARYREVSIAADRTTPGASQTALTLVTYQYVPNGNIGPRYAYTQDGGITYSASYWPPTNNVRTTWDSRHPVIRRSYDSDLFRALVTMVEPTTSWDTLVYAFSRGTSPSTWEDRNTPNDHQITGEYGAGVGYSSTVSGGYIVYREYALADVWSDGWNYTGTSEQPSSNVKSATAVPTFISDRDGVRLSLKSQSRVSATICDRTGRVIANVFNGTLSAGDHRLPVNSANVSEGVYFLRLSINGQVETAKLVRVQ